MTGSRSVCDEPGAAFFVFTAAGWAAFPGLFAFSFDANSCFTLRRRRSLRNNPSVKAQIVGEDAFGKR
jgi:hypothetical protein